MKHLLSIAVFTIAFLLFTTSAYATVNVSGQYLKKSNSVRAYFGSLKGVSKVSYTLMYNGNGVGQGVMGSFTPGKKKSVSKDFFLGTCSGKVCVYHKNIKNIQLEVTVKNTNGKTTVKIVKIK